MRKILIGVFGQGDLPIKKTVARKARIVGEEIAKSACVLVTGSCAGYPEEAYKGAKRFRGEIIGFSPAKNIKEHLEKYKLPDTDYATIIFTNTNFVQRDFLNVSSVDAGIVVGGKVGTLHELCIMLESGKIVGVLEKSGDCADLVKTIEKKLSKKYLGYKVVYDSNPIKLVDKVIEEIKKRRILEKK